MLDRLIQQAIVQVLTPIFDPTFSESSFGFRPKRSAHEAAKQVQRIIRQGHAYCIDVDLSKFFDHVDHRQLIELLRQRIDDSRMLWLIERFLYAGVMIEGQRHDTDSGVPHGSVLSPLLANVYLHYVLDQWFEQDVKP